MTTPNDSTPPAVTLSIDLPDTAEARAWITGWALCFCWPMMDGQLMDDPWGWTELGETAGAFTTFSGDAAWAKMTLRGPWIVEASGRAPLRVSCPVVDGGRRFTINFDAGFFARPWMREQLAHHVKLCRLLRPTFTLRSDDEAWMGPLLGATEIDLLASAGKVSYWHAGFFRQRLRASPRSAAVARDRDWSEAMIRAIIAELSRIGWTPRVRREKDYLLDLDVILTPADQIPIRQTMVAPFPDTGR